MAKGKMHGRDHILFNSRLGGGMEELRVVKRWSRGFEGGMCGQPVQEEGMERRGGRL